MVSSDLSSSHAHSALSPLSTCCRLKHSRREITIQVFTLLSVMCDALIKKRVFFSGVDARGERHEAFELKLVKVATRTLSKLN
jgi:hypothetical protein